MKYFNQLKNYIIASISEMKKVVWPTQKQTKNYSIVVIVMSLSMAVFFGVLDYIFNFGLSILIG